MIGSLATSLIKILRRQRQSSGSLMLGDLVSSPGEGCPPAIHIQRCLEGFDIQAYLLSQTFRNRLQQLFILHLHFKMKSHCSCQPCALVNLDLFLFLPPRKLTMLLQFSVCMCVWVCVFVCVCAWVCECAREAILQVLLSDVKLHVS